MKINRVLIEGVRGIASGDYDLDAVTVVTGANGAGKTTILGSVLWALTGRFPGLPAMSHGGAALMACMPSGSFQVSLHCTKRDGAAVLLTRSWQKGKGGLSLREVGGGNATGKAAEAQIVAMFGDVTFMADALGPEGSIWGLSREKRKAWASALCRSTAAWSTERLVEKVGPPSDNWNPNAMADAGGSLDLNIARLQESIREAQAIARKAESTASTVSGDSTKTPTKQEVQVKRKVAEDAAARATELRVALREAQSARSSAERQQQMRARIESQVANCQAILQRHEATPASERDAALSVALDDLEAQGLEAEMDETEKRQRVTSCEVLLATLKAQRPALEKASSDCLCPVCGQTGDFPSMLASLNADEAAAKAALSAALEEMSLAKKNSRALADRIVDVQRRLSAAISAKQDAEAQAAKLAALEMDLLSLGDLMAPSDEAQLQTSLNEAVADAAKKRDDYEHAASLITLSSERRVQEETAAAAREHAEQLKELLARMISARDKMLAESIEPLRAALDELSATAPYGGKWDARLDGDALDIGVATSEGFIPAETLSAGEKYRLTAALLVARSKLRREPWVGLVLDGFEQVSPASVRKETIESLAGMVAAGHVDNALFAAALETQASFGGAKTVHLSK